VLLIVATASVWTAPVTCVGRNETSGPGPGRFIGIGLVHRVDDAPMGRERPGHRQCLLEREEVVDRRVERTRRAAEHTSRPVFAVAARPPDWKNVPSPIIVEFARRRADRPHNPSAAEIPRPGQR
jgi:hypothetical protein